MVMPQQGNVTSFSWNANLPFYCYINNEDIYHYNGEIVGVSISKYKQVEEALSKCKNRLIELGEIKLPKTRTPASSAHFIAALIYASILPPF